MGFSLLKKDDVPNNFNGLYC